MPFPPFLFLQWVVFSQRLTDLPVKRDLQPHACIIPTWSNHGMRTKPSTAYAGRWPPKNTKSACWMAPSCSKTPRSQHLAGPWQDAGHFYTAYPELVKVLPMLWINPKHEMTTVKCRARANGPFFQQDALGWTLRRWNDYVAGQSFTPSIMYQIENKS